MSSPLLACVLAVCLAAAPSARAGEQEQGITLPGTDGRPALTGSVVFGAQPGSVDGWGWVRVELQNPEAVPQTAFVESVSNDRQFQVRRTISVPAGGRATAWIPQVGEASGTSLEISAPGHEATTLDQWRGNTHHAIVASVGPEPATERLIRAIGKVTAAGAPPTPFRGRVYGSPPTEFTVDQLPDPWTYLTSVSLLHVDGAAPGLDAVAPQRVIVQYVGAGGSVLVSNEASLPAGPLRELVARAVADRSGLEIRMARHGLGACWILEKPMLEKSEFEGPAFERFVASWQEKTEGRTMLWHDWPNLEIGLGPLGFSVPMRIPGLGELPVRLFFVLILAFTVLVGPVAYLMLRRRKQLSKMLWFVPAIGLGFAGTILLYGLFSEGLGTKGVVRSLTVLDQRIHEAFGAHSRTLYAGMSPSGLRVSRDTALFLPAFADSDPMVRGAGVSGERIRIEPEGGRWTGDVLPSRTPTVFRTITQGRARERLRFRRGTDGLYELLAGEGFQPIDAPSALLFHAPDGSWHALRGRGQRLTPVRLAEAHDLNTKISEAVTGAETVSLREPDEDFSGSMTISSPGREILTVPTHGWTQVLVADLPRGAYLGWMTSAPVFDDLGLDVQWLETRHLVMGLLAPEDVDG